MLNLISSYIQIKHDLFSWQPFYIYKSSRRAQTFTQPLILLSDQSPLAFDLWKIKC